jgi:hypothetical protein
MAAPMPLAAPVTTATPGGVPFMAGRSFHTAAARD